MLGIILFLNSSYIFQNAIYGRDIDGSFQNFNCCSVCGQGAECKFYHWIVCNSEGIYIYIIILHPSYIYTFTTCIVLQALYILYTVLGSGLIYFNTDCREQWLFLTTMLSISTQRYGVIQRILDQKDSSPREDVCVLKRKAI